MEKKKQNLRDSSVFSTYSSLFTVHALTCSVVTAILGAFRYLNPHKIFFLIPFFQGKIFFNCGQNRNTKNTFFENVSLIEMYPFLSYSAIYFHKWLFLRNSRFQIEIAYDLMRSSCIPCFRNYANYSALCMTPPPEKWIRLVWCYLKLLDSRMKSWRGLLAPVYR